MKFVEVKDVPKRNRQKNLQVFIDEFMSANIRCAKIEFKEHEYKNINIARSCIQTAVKRSGAPIYVVKRDDNIYFIRKDM